MREELYEHSYVQVNEHSYTCKMHQILKVRYKKLNIIENSQLFLLKNIEKYLKNSKYSYFYTNF